MGTCHGSVLILALVAAGGAAQAEGLAPAAEKSSEAAAAANRDRQQVAQSYRLCVAQAERRQALAAIATEKRYAKKVGVLNLSTLNDLKDDLLEADSHIADAKESLARAKAKPIACNGAKVSELIDCIATQHDPDVAASCVTDSMTITIALARTAAGCCGK